MDLTPIVASILGVVEGVTEFLPISSTGHLIVASHFLGLTGEKTETFEIFIQLGAILAVVVLYWRRLLALIPTDLIRRGGFAGVDGLTKIAAACAPVFVLGFLFHHAIKEHLFSVTTVAMAFIVGAGFMWFAEKSRKMVSARSLDEINLRQAFTIGAFQCLALWPGMSRSASTVGGGLLCGVERRTAAEFSFLVAIPVMCAAVGLDLLKSIHSLSSADIPVFAIGFIVSFVVALIAIKGFLRILKNTSLVPFAIYRIIIAIILLTFVR